MKKWFITYSNDLYAPARNRCVASAAKFHCFDHAIGYTPDDMDEAFRLKHSAILQQKTGNGLWLWKPYFIHLTMQKMEPGDLLVYCDAGSFFIRNPQHLLDSMGNDNIWVSDIPLVEKQFTKPELFTILGCAGTEYTDTPQIQGNFIAFRKSPEAEAFVEEWLSCCCRTDCMMPPAEPVQLPGNLTFVGHRYDQSVLSLLAKKHRLPIHLDPSQYGKNPIKYFSPGRLYHPAPHRQEYPVLLILHRSRSVNRQTVLRQWLCAQLPAWLVCRFSAAWKLYRQEKQAR